MPSSFPANSWAERFVCIAASCLDATRIYYTRLRAGDAGAARDACNISVPRVRRQQRPDKLWDPLILYLYRKWACKPERFLRAPRRPISPSNRALDLNSSDPRFAHFIGNGMVATACQAVDASSYEEMCSDFLSHAKQFVDVALAIANVNAFFWF